MPIEIVVFRRIIAASDKLIEASDLITAIQIELS